MNGIKSDPAKKCVYCGKTLNRKRYNGRLEDYGVFLRRKYCDRLMLQEGHTPTESEQDNKEKKGRKEYQDNVPGLPNKGRPTEPPPRYCQLRQYGNSLPEMPCTISYCRWDMGQEKNGMRVDRLRLLGNGVIPQQAELAFRTLIKLF